MSTQSSVTPRTTSNSTKLPLTTWLLGIFRISHDKKGISRIKLSRHLGTSYNAACVYKTETHAVFSDDFACFNAITDTDCVHDKIVCGGGRTSVEELKLYWVNTALGNLKSALRSIYYTIRPKYTQRYLAEFQYRINRRFDLSLLTPKFFHLTSDATDVGKTAEYWLNIDGN
ncbi:hypothetical protein GCM10027180_17720 [Microbulbifer echini]